MCKIIQQGMSSYQLIEIPSTDIQATLVLIHALAKILNIHLAGAGALCHIGLSRGNIGLRGLSCRATSEETTDGVAYR